MLKRIFHIDHIILTILTFTVTPIFMAVTVNIPYLDPVSRALENFSLDEVFYDIIRNSGDEAEDCDAISIVDVTDLYDRARFADLIDSLDYYEAYAVGFDIVFQDMRGDTAGSILLAEAVEKTQGYMVYGCRLENWDIDKGEYTSSSSSFFADKLTDELQGFTMIPNDRFGKSVNTVQLKHTCNGDTLRSLTYRLAQLYDEASTKNLTGSTLNINFMPTNFTVIPFDSLWAYSDYITSRVVLVGAYREVDDYVYSPIGQIPGVKYHAYALNTILNSKELFTCPRWLSILITMLAVWLTSVLYNEYRLFCQKHNNKIFFYFIETSLIVSWLLFMWSALLVGIAFYAFVHYGWSMDMTLLLINVLMIVMNSNFYSACITYLYTRTHWKWLTRSMYMQKEVADSSSFKVENDATDQVKTMTYTNIFSKK